MLSWLYLLLVLFVALIRCDDCSSSSGNTTDDRQTVTIAAILPITNTVYPWAWPRVAPALNQAISRVNCDPWLLPGLKLQLVNGNSENSAGYCSDSMAPLVAVDLKFAHDPWAFIGPGCDYSSSPVARFTTHWDVPMVTAGARAIGFKFYEAVTNTGPTHAKLGELSLKLQETFGWRQRAMLVYTDNKDSNDDRPYFFAVEGVYELLRQQNITTFDYSLDSDINYKLAAQKIRDNGRVVYVCTPSDTFRSLMVQFWKDGIDLEEFVFLFIDLFAEGLGSGPTIQPWYRGDQDDYAAKQAFKSVKVLTYMEPQNPEYFQFVENLKRDAKESFNFTIKDSLYNLIAASFYDGVMLYSQALNETLSQQRMGPGPIKRPKGDLVTRKMWNRNFTGVMGMVEMDAAGDREIDFAMWDMIDFESGEFQVVSVYKGGTKQLVMQEGLNFQWPGGSPPVDIPECGFKNDNPTCLARTVTMHQMVAIVICFVFIIIVTITVFIYREVTARPRFRGWRINV